MYGPAKELDLVSWRDGEICLRSGDAVSPG